MLACLLIFAPQAKVTNNHEYNESNLLDRLQVLCSSTCMTQVHLSRPLIEGQGCREKGIYFWEQLVFRKFDDTWQADLGAQQSLLFTIYLSIVSSLSLSFRLRSASRVPWLKYPKIHSRSQ